MMKAEKQNNIAESMKKMKRAYAALFDDYLSPEEEEDLDKKIKENQVRSLKEVKGD